MCSMLADLQIVFGIWAARNTAYLPIQLSLFFIIIKTFLFFPSIKHLRFDMFVVLQVIIGVSTAYIDVVWMTEES